MKTILKQFLKLDLAIHNFTYRLAGYLATKLEDGVHPKHRLIGYHHFFREHVNQGDIVLDIGCGNGELTREVSYKVQWIYGMETDEAKLRYARDRNFRPNIIYMRGDATNREGESLIKAQKWDVIILSNVLEHIEDRIEFLKYYGEKADKILLRVPLLNRSWLPLYMKDLGIDYRLDKGHFIEYTLGTLIDELEQAGLRLTEHSTQFGEIWGVAVHI